MGMVSSCPQCHQNAESYCTGKCHGCDKDGGWCPDIMLLAAGGCIATPDEAQEGSCVSSWQERKSSDGHDYFSNNPAVRVQAVAKCVDKPNGPKYCSSWCNTPGVTALAAMAALNAARSKCGPLAPCIRCH